MIDSFKQAFLATTALVLVTTPVRAINSSTLITEIKLNTTTEGVELILTSATNNQPQISTTTRGNSLIINLANAQLNLSQGKTYRQDNPATGITSVVVTQLDANNVWVIVNGNNSLPTEQVPRQSAQSITLSFSAKVAPLAPTPLASPQQVAPPSAETNYSDINLDESGSQIMRNLPLNEIKATSNAIVARNLTSLAETGGSVGGNTFNSGNNSFNTFNPSFGSASSAATAQTSIKRSTATTENINYQGAKEFLELLGANNGGANKQNTITAPSSTQAIQQAVPFNFPTQTTGAVSRILNGLEVIADPRTNSLTLIGSRRLVEIATMKLNQLDVQVKQVAINIKIIDVDLSKSYNSNTDLQYRASNTLGFSFNSAGEFITNLGRNANAVGVAVPLAQNLLINIVASIRNQSAKILTNPTLVVQEGSSAQVNLTQEIFSGFETIQDTSLGVIGGGTIPLRRRPIIRPAGVIVNVAVERIDNNGFITLDVSPEISAPSGQVFQDQGSEARLLLQRRLETGRVRLRDGQTLLLTGIIQDQDRRNVTKIPILGDIPLLGLLFRRTESINERREVVVVVTPQILDSSDNSPVGLRYNISPEVQRFLKP
jgi:type IV pilus assembly protein PilQ